MSAALPGLGPEVGGLDVTPRRTVGRTTGVVAGAGTAGPALAAIIVHLWPNLADVEWALATLLGLGLGLFAGYLLPPVKPAVVTPSPDEMPGGPDYQGEAGAAPGDVLAVPPEDPGPDAAPVVDTEPPRV